VGNGVVGHVNGGVGERLNNELLVPRKLGSKSSSTGASPLFKPSKNVDEFFLAFFIVSVEVFRLDMG
jgi:hypothetical protein